MYLSDAEVEALALSMLSWVSLRGVWIVGVLFKVVERMGRAERASLSLWHAHHRVAPVHALQYVVWQLEHAAQK